MKSAHFLFATVLVLGTAGCAKRHAPESLPTTSGRTSVSTAFTDGQIVGVLTKTDESEATEGRLVSDKTADLSVLQFANRMTTEHEEGARELDLLASRRGFRPEPSRWSAHVDDATRAEVAEIGRRSGTDLDRQYVRHEVEEHAELMNLLNRELLPDAGDPELRMLLAKVRTREEAHLAHARRLDADLAR